MCKIFSQLGSAQVFGMPSYLLIHIKVAKISVGANYSPWSAHRPPLVIWSQHTVPINMHRAGPLILIISGKNECFQSVAFASIWIMMMVPTDFFHSTLPFIQRVGPRDALRDHIYRLPPSLCSCRNPWSSRKRIWNFANDPAQRPGHEGKWQKTHPVENGREIYEVRMKEERATLCDAVF